MRLSGVRLDPFYRRDHLVPVGLVQQVVELIVPDLQGLVGAPGLRHQARLPTISVTWSSPPCITRIGNATSA